MIDLFEKSRNNFSPRYREIMEPVMNDVNKVYEKTLLDHDYHWLVTPWFDNVEEEDFGLNINMHFYGENADIEIFFVPDLSDGSVWMNSECHIDDKAHVTHIVDVSSFSSEDYIAEVLSNVCHAFQSELLGKKHIKVGDKVYIYNKYYDEMYATVVDDDTSANNGLCVVKFDDNEAEVSMYPSSLTSAEHWLRREEACVSND